MKNTSLILFGKTLSQLFRTLNLGNGSTWPGHIALKGNPHFIRDMLEQSKIKTILIAGTNGKTTTATLIADTLKHAGKRVIQNSSGANLVNGIASTLLLKSKNGKLPYDYAIFEVDENALRLLLKEMTPDYLILMNLFRDQLDRYGEVNTITSNWSEAIKKLPAKTNLILNADDPQIAYLGLNQTSLRGRTEGRPPANEVRQGSGKLMKQSQTVYFGLQPSQFTTKTKQHAADSVSCPKCGTKLIFDAIAFSHLGDWHCPKCKLKRPEVAINKFTIYPLPGLYNKYNTLAALRVLQTAKIPQEKIEEAFTHFKPAFGRQEIISYKGKRIQIFLSKNPTSFNQSYATMKELGAKHLLLVLNDRIPDGRDISWIWDTELPGLDDFTNVLVSGDRAYDMALRIKYEGYKNIQTFEQLEEAINTGVDTLNENETLYILPTYSAMLDVRKIVTGKKIL